MSQSRKILGKEDGPFWYNEVPPSVFFNAALLKEGRAPIYLQKWQREILDQDLDLNQRQLLKDERAARVYLNPPPVQLQYKRNQECVQDMKERGKYSLNEREKMQTLGARQMSKTFAIYGLNYREVAGLPTKKSSQVLSSKGPICTRLRKIPPFRGPHALHLLPWDTAHTKPSRRRYQVKVFGDKMAAHELSEQDSRDLKQYLTTPLAVWRQHRFASPHGCQFKDIKEQVKLAKHLAMLAVKNKNEADAIVVDHARLTSHFKPWTGQADTDPDCEDLQGDRVFMEKARLEMEHKLLKLREARREASSAIQEARRESQLHKHGSHGAASDTSMDDPGAHPAGKEDGEGAKATARKKRARKYAVEEEQGAFFTDKPQFSVEKDFLEDLQQEDQHTRDQLAHLFQLQPIGNFYPDPRDDPQFAVCFKKGAEDKKRIKKKERKQQ